MKTIKFAHLILIMGAQVMTSCKYSSTLIVYDESNKPISNATFVVQGMSIQGIPGTTDEDGKILIDKKELMGAKWIVVSKEGFENEKIDLQVRWPDKVVMRRKNIGTEPTVPFNADGGRR